MIYLNPGIYKVTDTVSMSDLSGQAIVRATYGTFNEQLNRRRESGHDSASADSFSENDIAITAE